MGDENKGAAAAAVATDSSKKSGGTFLMLVGDDHYKGQDPGTGEFLHLIRGDVASVSPQKAAQLTRDYPKLFRKATEADFLASTEDRSKRQKALAEKLKADEKRAAANDRTRAIDDDDDDTGHDD